MLAEIPLPTLAGCLKKIGPFLSLLSSVHLALLAPGWLIWSAYLHVVLLTVITPTRLWLIVSVSALTQLVGWLLVALGRPAGPGGGLQ